MIRYSLHCDRSHTFESWFQSSSAYEVPGKAQAGELPGVRFGQGAAIDHGAADRQQEGPHGPSNRDGQSNNVPAPAQPAEVTAPGSTPLLMAQERELRAKLRELRDQIVKNADNVGERFPNEARKMHYGDIEHRPIYGEASPEEARSLIDEGVEVSPLPVLPDDRN